MNKGDARRPLLLAQPIHAIGATTAANTPMAEASERFKVCLCFAISPHLLIFNHCVICRLHWINACILRNCSCNRSPRFVYWYETNPNYCGWLRDFEQRFPEVDVRQVCCAHVLAHHQVGWYARIGAACDSLIDIAQSKVLWPEEWRYFMNQQLQPALMRGVQVRLGLWCEYSSVTDCL